MSSAQGGVGDGRLNCCLLISSGGYGEDQNTLFSEMPKKNDRQWARAAAREILS